MIKRIATFIKFCHERMKRRKLKRLQLEDYGRDEIFVYKKFTNLAREQDKRDTISTRKYYYSLYYPSKKERSF